MSKKPNRIVTCLILSMVTSATVMAAAIGKKSPDLPGAAAGMATTVIVQYASSPTQTDLNFVAARGGQIRATWRGVRTLAVTLPSSALDDLAAQPDVMYISPDRPVQNSMNYTVPTTGADLALRYGYDGAGITVAVLDSGIGGHPDLAMGEAPRVKYRQSFLGPGGRLGADPCGHGTHVAGIVAGSGASSPNGMLRGIAPKAGLVDLQVLDQNGVGSDSTVIAALERVIDLKDTYGIRVVNLSLGRPNYEAYTRDPLCQAVEAVWKAGITVVVAAGNFGRSGFPGSGGYWTITAPGNDPNVITVGAMKTEGTPTRSDDLVASYSSKGPTFIDELVKPDLVAPGNQITSLLSGINSTLALEFPRMAAFRLGRRGDRRWPRRDFRGVGQFCGVGQFRRMGQFRCLGIVSRVGFVSRVGQFGHAWRAIARGCR